MKKKLAREQYISGKAPSDIALSLGVTRTTIYNYKASDLKDGIDWDELKYLKVTDIKDLEKKEKEFLYTLVKSFEEALSDIQTLTDPKEKLKLLTQYASTYYKLKIPNKEDCKIKKAEIASKTIYTISDLALKTQNDETISFLSQNADEIIQAVIR